MSITESQHKNWSFVLKGFPYLGYMVTRYGIKHDPKKAQYIMYIGRHTTTEVWNLMGMV